MSFNTEYKTALNRIWHYGIETNPRGIKSREMLFYMIELNDPNDNIVTIPGFETNVDYAQEELNWYFSGTNRIDYSPWIEKTWRKYSDDGIHVNSAYGHRIFGCHKDFIDQWDWCVKKLMLDRDSRQAVINLNYCGDKKSPTLDFVCTIAFQIFIRDGRLHWITMMRSQDIYFGTRNDIYCFTEMQKKMAKELGCKLGVYRHLCNSLHLYENQYDKVKRLVGDLI